MKVFHSFIDLIGHTPIVQLHQIEEKYNLKSHIYAKVESFNPAGSVKDRVAKQMIIDAIDEGKLKPGATIIEQPPCSSLSIEYEALTTYALHLNAVSFA